MPIPKDATARASSPTRPEAPVAGLDAEPATVPGYRLVERVHKTTRASLYRAVRDSDGAPVVLKVLAHDALTAENVARHRHEYEVLRRLRSRGVVQAYEFKRAPGATALVIEDFGGGSLKAFIESGSPFLTGIDNKIGLALKLVAALRDVHAANLIHKDINPNNIIVNTDTGELKLIDFELATELAGGHAATAIPTSLLGTLPYIAPEQTGRMNRAVDYRSDYYSLGVTLYELFTGKVPFPASDALELIHCHMARLPTPPHELDPQVPQPLSEIVMKLLAKTPEGRYQSLWGLEADLERCLGEWQAHGTVAPFTIDALGVTERFQLPQRLYGRDNELATLLAAFDDASGGRCEALLLTGQSGIGKSRLVREVYKPITAKRGYIAAGKFDQFQRNVPYSALLAALRELVRQFLSEDEARLTHWQRALRQALGDNGRVLTDLLPELTLVIGEQPPAPTLGPRETQERLTGVMRSFFATVCRREHPLVLYLDDLQWADSATLGLLGSIATEMQLNHLLLVFAYRDNEVDSAHPVVALLERLRSDGIEVRDIALAPLAPRHVEELLADALGAEPGDVTALAARIHAKTGGNPYFVDEFLKSLHAKKLLYFDGEARRWCWDLDAVQAQDVTENVVGFMTQRILELEPESQRLLWLAACLGSSFDLHALALAAERPAAEVVQALHEAVARGFIVPTEEGYAWATADDAESAARARLRFAHDRVQKAAYGLIPEHERAEVHYRIGRLLQQRLGPAGLEEALFEVVNHLNAGRTAAPVDEKRPIARLNLAAGRKARAAAVLDAALAYFQTGLELVGESSWSSDYALALALTTETALAAPLTGNHAVFNACFESVRTNARGVLDKIPLYEAKIATEHRRGDVNAATQTGLETLALLGVRFPERPHAAHLLYQRMRAKLALRRRTPESLLDHRLMTDRYRVAESRVLQLLLNVFHGCNRRLLALTLFRSLYLCARYGNSPAAPFVYASHAMSLCAAGHIDQGYRFGRLALALLDRLDAGEQRALVSCVVHANVDHWKQHCRDTFADLLEAYQRSADVGDLDSGSMALLHLGFQLFHAGEPLDGYLKTVQGYLETLRKALRNKRGEAILELYRDAALYLTGAAERDLCFAAAPGVQAHAEKKHPYTFHFFKLFLAIHRDDADAASRHAGRMRAYARTVVGVLRFGDLYDGLAHVMMHPALRGRAGRRNRKAIRRTIARLRLFAQHSPGNYLHKWHLLQAEYARLEGRTAAAEAAYDAAITAAGENGFLHEEALASELIGRHYLAQGRNLVAQAYLAQARLLYARWGAARKVAWLDARYPQLNASVRTNETGRATTILTGTTSSSDLAPRSFDLPALMKALKTIAEENVHSQILGRTADVVMQFAGAEKALLLLPGDDDELYIEADMDTSSRAPELLKSIPMAHSERLCQAVVHYVRRTKTSVVIHDAQEPQSLIPGLPNDGYVRRHGVRSILCLPVVSGGEGGSALIGLLYVENNQSPYAFTDQRVETLEIICLAVAGRLELSRKAVTDALTGLYNRAYFESMLFQEFSLAKRKDRAISLVMVDIDHFKQFNDTWGHQVGDQVLRHVAQTLKDACRDSDVVARYGGEEMAVVLPETPGADALEVAERVRAAIENSPVTHEGQQLKVTVSLGVTDGSEPISTPDAFFRAADEALYRAKAEGRNRVMAAWKQ